MKKHEKKILIIFLLFFIYFITIINFSLKFREGKGRGRRGRSRTGISGGSRGYRSDRSEKEKLTAEEKKKLEASVAVAVEAAQRAEKEMKDKDKKKELKAACTDTSLGKYKRYALAKQGKLKCIDCKTKEQKTTCKRNDHNKTIDKTTCETSACTRAYKGAMMTPFFPVLPSINDVNVWDETQNPCMTYDFCKNCKKCNEAKTPTTGHVTLDNGTEFSCAKCKMPIPPHTATNTDKKSWWSRCGF